MRGEGGRAECAVSLRQVIARLADLRHHEQFQRLSCLQTSIAGMQMAISFCMIGNMTFDQL